VPRLRPDDLSARRAEILEAARAAFARYGYEGATVRELERATGRSRGAIFHHFPDKEALFAALAEQDAETTAEMVSSGGLIAAMRRLPTLDPGWLGVTLEVSRRLRTDPQFKADWQRRIDGVTKPAEQRLAAGRAAGTVRDDIPVSTLVTFLRLVYDGLVVHLAAGTPDPDLDVVLDLVEQTVRKDRPR
jgi:AcrR family transcriptional regulator